MCHPKTPCRFLQGVLTFVGTFAKIKRLILGFPPKSLYLAKLLKFRLDKMNSICYNVAHKRDPLRISLQKRGYDYEKDFCIDARTADGVCYGSL